MKCVICWLHFSTSFWQTSVRKQSLSSLQQDLHHNIITCLFLMHTPYLQMTGSSFMTSCLWAFSNGLGGEKKQISLFWLILFVSSLMIPAYSCFMGFYYLFIYLFLWGIFQMLHLGMVMFVLQVLLQDCSEVLFTWTSHTLY